MKNKFVRHMRRVMRSKLAITAALVVLVVVLLPSRAASQFGLDPCCAII
jgi:hypothetical protein